MRLGRRKCLSPSTGTSAMRQKTTTGRENLRVDETVPAEMCNHSHAARLPLGWQGTAGFTLAELLVTVGVLALLVFLAAQLLITAATVTTLGHKQMDAD